jgi:hypothetical protein
MVVGMSLEIERTNQISFGVERLLFIDHQQQKRRLRAALIICLFDLES